MASNITEDTTSFKPPGRVQWQLAFTITNSIINITSTVLNVMTIIVYRRHKQLETKSNIIIVSMAMAGILLAASEFLTTLGAKALSTWHLTKAWCVAQNYIEAVLSYFILHAIALTSIQRQVIISKILKPVLHKKLWKMKLVVLTIVLYIIAIVLPLFTVFDAKRLNMTVFHGCSYSSERNDVASFYYELVQIFLLFVVPSLIIFGNYVYIHQQIRKKSRASRRRLRRGNFMSKNKNRKTDMQTTVNIIVILLFLVVLYFPKQTFVIAILFKTTKLKSSSLFVAIILSNIFQQFASFIHILTNTRFRVKFSNTLSVKKERTNIRTPGSSTIGRKQTIHSPHSFCGHQAAHDYEPRTRSFSLYSNPHRSCNTKSSTILTRIKSSTIQLSQLENRTTTIGDCSKEHQNTHDNSLLTLTSVRTPSESNAMKLLPTPSAKNAPDAEEMLTPAAVDSALDEMKTLFKSSDKQASDEKPTMSTENGAIDDARMLPSPSVKQALANMKTSTSCSVHAATDEVKMRPKSSFKQASNEKKKLTGTSRNGATNEVKMLAALSVRQTSDVMKILPTHSFQLTSDETKTSITLSMNVASVDVKVFPVPSLNCQDKPESTEMAVAVVNLALNQIEQPVFV